MSLILREDDHTYWLGYRRLPSVSEIIRPVCNYDGIREDVLERKSDIGRATHLLCEWHDKRVKIDPKSIDDEVRPYFSAWKDFTRVMKPKWLVIEEMRSDVTQQYAGTMDRFGIINGAMWLIDIKTVAKLQPATGLQTAAYTNLLTCEERTAQTGLLRRGAVKLNKNGKWEMLEYKNPRDLTVFMGLLALTNWRIENGID